MIFFTKNPNLRVTGRATEGDFFHTKSKSNFFFLVGVGWGVDGWTDEQAKTNLPLQFLRSKGHNNASMYKLCPLRSQFMTILSFDLQV